MEGTRQRVLIVDDDSSVRTAMQRLFVSHGFKVETYASAAQFRGAVPIDDGAACLVLDIRLPDGSGLDLQMELQASDRPIPIIFITGYGDIPMGINAMKKGATDFLPKPVNEEDLLDAVVKALEKDRDQKNTYNHLCGLKTRLKRLTPREYQLLHYIISGLLNKQIAFALNISEKTVKVHRARIMAKLEARSVADLVRLCEQVKISPAPEIEKYR